MPPTPVRMMLTATSSWGSLAISSSSASAEPATSALTSRLSSLSSPAWMSLKMSSSERLRPRAAGVLLLLEALLALVRELARAAVVLDGADVLAGLGDAVEAEHLDRDRRGGPP